MRSLSVNGTNPNAQLMRQMLRQDANVFQSIFKDADLTQVERIKQWRNVVIYAGHVSDMMSQFAPFRDALHHNIAFFTERLQSWKPEDDKKA